MLPVRYEHILHIKSKYVPRNWPWRSVFPAKYEYYVHIKRLNYLGKRPWRLIGLRDGEDLTFSRK
jgi:hypothetical protein